MVQVNRDEYIPADIVLLSTSESKHSCLIETKSLDGETNLKTKRAPLGLHSLIPTDPLALIQHKGQCVY